ncbi:putative pectinesterase 63 [Pistacia vera]|uniref:putative pectinesterase 63 n=1 Tax=Pistacia vera TaxID=55513 RepID=UPI0012630694|nr:putative pectinesterase 63 [Pistacia vera]XP_031272907.1 putative pectinesterase 63 [Pistacia vera]
MAYRIKQFAILAIVLTTTLLSSQLIPTVFCTDIPSEKAKLDDWIGKSIKDYNHRKTKLNHTKSPLYDILAAAEAHVKVITVKKDGSGDFKTVTDAIKSVPAGNSQRVVIKIGGGEYREKIIIDRSKKFITLYGDPNELTKIVYDGTATKYGTFNSATVIVESHYFVAVNIAFVNSSPMPDSRRTDAQAVALRISGDKAAFHNCKFAGFQDTLCDDKGRHFFRDCYIEGTVDFIFGNGQSLYLNTTIKSVAKGLGVITANGREKATEKSGFTFVHCTIVGTGDIYLGRAWKESPRVIFAYTYMGTLINSEGWSNSMIGEKDNKAVYYGEYKCKGPGASASGRAKFARILSDEEAEPFLSMTYLNGNKWILPPPTV